MADALSPSPSRRSLALRTSGLVTLLLVTFLGAGWLGYRAYLATPDTVAAAPPPSQHAATARRAVLFVIDAFTPAKAFDPAVMPTVARLAGEGASGIVHTGSMTTTAPCVYSLTTGRPGSLIQAIFNFHSSETRVDSLPSLVAADGGKVAIAGDPAWHRQFAWLVPETDRHESPEPGITVEHHIDAFDRDAVDFVVEKLGDPAYRLLILHLGSVDAVGHMVTPLSPRYAEQLTFMDGLVARMAAAVDRDSTLLVVTGDHGMASRGTHGGEDEAKLTPYVMVGPGVKRGVVLDAPQTALTSTLAALLGLPFLPVSEWPPLTTLLERSPEEARALTTEYFAAKLGAARLAGAPDLPPEKIDEAGNRKLNELLFGADSARVGWRLATALLSALGLVLASLAVWRSAPLPMSRSALLRLGRPPLSAHVALALAAPLGLGALATGIIWIRGMLPFRSTTIALVLVGILILVLGAVVLALLRSPELLSRFARWETSLFLPLLGVLMAPSVNSHWLHPQLYFEVLLLGAVATAATVLWGRRDGVIATAVTTAMIYAPRLTSGAWQETLVLACSLAVLAVTLYALRREAGAIAVADRILVTAAVAAGWWWRLAPSTTTASMVLALVAIGVGLTVVAPRDPRATAALLVALATSIFLIMASESYEALVFVGAALVALLISGRSFDVERAHALTLVAAVAILLRVCLYFGLGDQYNISSIRTAPGFVLTGEGTPLLSVTLLLLLKYSLPWLLIFAMLLPSLAAASRSAAVHLIDLLILGYVARFAAVTAVIDPLRALPNGMDGIVGMFCVTWAEFLTFGIAATLAVAVLEASPAAAAAAALGSGFDRLAPAGKVRWVRGTPRKGVWDA